MIIPPMVTDYRGHRQTLFPVREINLKVYTDAILTQITWPALEFESRAMHRQPAKPSAYCAKPRGQGFVFPSRLHKYTWQSAALEKLEVAEWRFGVLRLSLTTAYMCIQKTRIGVK